MIVPTHPTATTLSQNSNAHLKIEKSGVGVAGNSAPGPSRGTRSTPTLRQSSPSSSTSLSSATTHTRRAFQKESYPRIFVPSPAETTRADGRASSLPPPPLGSFYETHCFEYLLIIFFAISSVYLLLSPRDVPASSAKLKASLTRPVFSASSTPPPRDRGALRHNPYNAL